MHRHDGVGDEQPLGEYHGFLRNTVAVGILKNDDSVVGFRAGLDVWVGGTHRDPGPPPCVPVQVDRIGKDRVRGKQVQREAIGNRHAGQFVGRIRGGNVAGHFVLGIVVNRFPLVDPLDGITMSAGCSQSGDAFLGRRHQPVEILHLVGEMPHLVRAK